MNMQRGDHLSSSRIGYSHHGIYLGEGQVIHYAGYANGPSAGKVEIVSIDDFAAGNGVHVAAHPFRLYGTEETIQRAYSRLGEDLYSLFMNNCEHFVFWCLYGVHWSTQVAKGSVAVVWASSRVVTAATASKTGELLVARSLVSGVAGMVGKSSAVQGCATIVGTQASGVVSAAAQTVVAKAVAVTASTSAGSSVAAAAAGLGAGTATAAATGTAGAVAAGFVGGAGLAAAATAAVPVLIVGGLAAAAAYAVSEIFDW